MRGFRIITALIALLSVGGVYATWHFSDAPPEAVQKEVNITMMSFEFAPEQLLPGGTEEKPEPGKNHFSLIDLILNESDKGYGLNINNNVLIHQYLKNTSVIYSNQKVSGGNLKFILDPSNNTHGLYYCIEKNPIQNIIVTPLQRWIYRNMAGQIKKLWRIARCF